MLQVFYWLLCGSLTTQLKPHYASEKHEKWLEGTALKLPPGLTRPGPCEPEFRKNDLPANLFLLHVLPQNCNKFTPALKYVEYKHTLWHVFENLRHVWVSYILVCVRKHKSNLPTNICTTVGKKTQQYVEKINLLSETTLLPYFMTAWCVFFYQSVHFFFQWCLSCFSSQQYASMIFVKQCW